MGTGSGRRVRVPIPTGRVRVPDGFHLRVRVGYGSHSGKSFGYGLGTGSDLPGTGWVRVRGKEVRVFIPEVIQMYVFAVISQNMKVKSVKGKSKVWDLFGVV